MQVEECIIVAVMILTIFSAGLISHPLSVKAAPKAPENIASIISTTPSLPNSSLLINPSPTSTPQPTSKNDQDHHPNPTPTAKPAKSSTQLPTASPKTTPSPKVTSFPEPLYKLPRRLPYQDQAPGSITSQTQIPTPATPPTPMRASATTKTQNQSQSPEPNNIPTSQNPTLTLTSAPPPTPQASSARIGIYRDQTCVTAATAIDWGTLYPGETTNMVLYVRNEANSPVTLSKALSNWNPASLSTYLSLSWDYSNQAVAAGNILKVTLTLTIASNTPAVSNFGFSTTITATG